MVTPKYSNRSDTRSAVATSLQHKSTTSLQSQQPQSSLLSSYYLVIAVKVLLILIILFTLPQFVTGKNRPSQQRRKHKLVELRLRSMRYECQNVGVCALLNVPEESLNCVNQCVSAPCYNQIYNNADVDPPRLPLEDGEVDVFRAKEFDKCAQDEIRQQQQRKHRVQTGQTTQ
jgi:Domain of unknown function (DUF4787)